jgi:hypothetical protein
MLRCGLCSSPPQSDFLSVGLVGRIYPASVIEKQLDEHEVNTLRNRRLPALVTSYYCIALSLYPQAAYEEVYAVVAEGLSDRGRGKAASAPVKSAISAARQRIGFAPLKGLMAQVCQPLADPITQPHAFYAAFAWWPSTAAALIFPMSRPMRLSLAAPAAGASPALSRRPNAPPSLTA